MESLLSLGAGIIAMACGGFLLYLFLFGPLPYIISAAIKKVEGRNYWKAFGVFGISIVAAFILQLILKLFLEGFALSAVLFLATIAVQLVLILLLYKVDFKKALGIWTIAVLIFIGISVVLGILVVVLGTVLASSGIKDIINLIQQQISYLPMVV
jgi:hypothetical protein